MSTDNSIFEKNNNNSETPNNDKTPEGGNTGGVPAGTQFEDLLSGIKNERGERKYANVEEALKGAAHAQSYIQQLQNEVSQLKGGLEKVEAVEAKYVEIQRAMDALISKQQEPGTPPVKSVSEDDISAIVNNVLTSKQKEQIMSENVKSVTQKMVEKFGADAEKVFYTKAAEMGMTPESFNELAKTSPQAVLNLIGINSQGKPSNSQPVTSTQNTSGITPNEESHLGRSKFSILNGSTTADLMQAVEDAKKMTTELEALGLSSADLSDPKNYRKYMQGK